LPVGRVHEVAHRNQEGRCSVCPATAGLIRAVVAVLALPAIALGALAVTSSSQEGLPSSASVSSDTVTVFIVPRGSYLGFGAPEWQSLASSSKSPSASEPPVRARRSGWGTLTPSDPNAVGAMDALLSLPDTLANAANDFVQVGLLAAGADVGASMVLASPLSGVTSVVNNAITAVTRAQENVIEAVMNQNGGELCFDRDGTFQMATPVVVVGPGQELAVTVDSPTLADNATINLSGDRVGRPRGLHRGLPRWGLWRLGGGGDRLRPCVGLRRPLRPMESPEISALAADGAGQNLRCVTIDTPVPTNPQAFDALTNWKTAGAAAPGSS